MKETPKQKAIREAYGKLWDKVKIGDIIWIEYAGEPTKVKVLNIDKDHLLVRGVRLLRVFPSWMGKKVLSKHDYYFRNFTLLNPGK